MPDEPSIHIGALAVQIHIPASGSLKTKRRSIKSIKDRTRARFNVSVSEVGDHDKWQKAVLGFSMISNDKNLISGEFQKIVELIESVDEVQVLGHQIEFV